MYYGTLRNDPMNSESHCAPPLEVVDARPVLEALIRRAGVSLEIGQFMSVVSTAYQHAQKVVEPDLDMPLRFRNSRSYYGFSNSLRLAELDLRQPPSVLALGCGTGYAGCSSDYAASVARDVLSATRSIDQVDLSPASLDEGTPLRTYDLVVSHSLAHFVLDLPLFFRYLRRRVAPGGALVIGHEPNAAFWSDQRVTRLREVHQRARRLQRSRSLCLRPSALVARLRRLPGRRESPPSIFHVANNLLKSRYHFRAELTPAEMVATVDPHFPSNHSFRLGVRGLDPERLPALYMPEFSLRWVDTSEYQGIDASEAIRLGLPGSTFSALYRKRAIP